jgi:hypothetical protein
LQAHQLKATRLRAPLAAPALEDACVLLVTTCLQSATVRQQAHRRLLVGYCTRGDGAMRRRPIDVDTTLYDEKRMVMGHIDEFPNIALDPLYSVSATFRSRTPPGQSYAQAIAHQTNWATSSGHPIRRYMIDKTRSCTRKSGPSRLRESCRGCIR